MEQSTFIDIFSEAGRAVRGVRNLVDENEGRKADAFIKTVPGWFDNEINNYTRDHPYSYKGNPDDPAELEKYTNEYRKKQENFIKDSFAKKFGSRAGIGYYKQAMDQMQTHALEKARGFALLEQDKTRIGNAEINFFKSVASDRENKPPEQAMISFEHNLNLLKEYRPVTPEEEHKYRTAQARLLYEKAFDERLGQVHDVNDLQAATSELKESFSFMPPDVVNVFDNEGNLTGTEERPWSYEGKSEWEQKQIKAQTERIQGEHFGTLREQKSYVDRCLASGDLDEAIRASRIGGAWLNKAYNPNNIQYANLSEDQRYAARDWFDVGKLEVASKMSVEDRLFELDPGAVIRAALPGGKGFVVTNPKTGEGVRVETLRDGWDKYISSKEKAFRRSKGEDGYGILADNEWVNERERYFKEFKALIRPIMQEDTNTSLWSIYSKLLDFETYNKKDGPFFVKNEFEGMLRDRFVQDCMSLAFDLVWGGADHVELKNRVTTYIMGNIEMQSKWGGTSTQEGDVFKQLAAWSGEVMAGKANDMVFSDIRPETAGLFSGAVQEDDLVWRRGKEAFKKDAHDVRDAEWTYTAIILGLPKEKLKPSWMLSDDKERDPIPKGIFIVEQGELAGTYFLNYDKNAYPFVWKQNDKGGWEPFKKGYRPLTTGEQNEQIKKTQTDMGQMLADKKHPITGEFFDYTKETPPVSASDVIATAPFNLEIWASHFQQMLNNAPPMGQGTSDEVIRKWRNDWEMMSVEKRTEAWAKHLRNQGKK